jgi:hypothetical protein
MLDHDIFTHNANSNRRRVYALASWQVMHKVRGWYYRKTDSRDDWKGPYSSEISVCLMLARQLRRELLKRDGMPS